MKIKVILEENKTNFEKQLEEYINKEYKIINSNIIINHDPTKLRYEKLNNYIYIDKLENYNNICFYALLQKE